MINIDETTHLVFPMSTAFSILGTTIFGVGSAVWWALTTFYKKAEAEKLEQRVMSQVERMETIVERVAQDTSYIRGWISSGKTPTI